MRAIQVALKATDRSIFKIQVDDEEITYSYFDLEESTVTAVEIWTPTGWARAFTVSFLADDDQIETAVRQFAHRANR